MARSDLLLALVKAGKGTSDPRFRQTVEALIAEERAKRHDILAEQISNALNANSNGQTSTTGVSPVSIPDLIYEFNPDRTFESLVLPSAVIEELRQLVEEQHRADLLRSYSLAPRHRILLVGPPGNGKTSVAFALAHALMVPLLTVRYEGLIGSYLGETAARLRKIFDYARQRACVIFFDEFDTVGKERGDIHETGEIKRVVSTLLLQMDQLPAYVVIVTATNHPELLDRAVWRRFELRLHLPPPSPCEIQQFLNRLFAGFHLDRTFRPSEVGHELHGATYSDIENIFKDVARRAVLESPSANTNRILNDRIAAWQRRAEPNKTPKRGKVRE